MPFIRLDVDATRTPAELKAISDNVYQSLIDTVHAPVNDLFHVVTKHGPGELIYSKDYLGIQRSDHFLYIQIYFYAGRTIEQKKLIYKTIAERLEKNVGVRKEDVFISIIDTPKENWSYGNGEAQFAPLVESVAVVPISPTEKSTDWVACSALTISILCLVLLIVLFLKKAS